MTPSVGATEDQCVSLTAQTPAHTQPRKVTQTTNSHILQQHFEVQKLAAICPNTVSDAQCFLSETDSNLIALSRRTTGTTTLTQVQPNYSLTRTLTQRKQAVSGQQRSRKTNITLEVKLHFEGSALRTNEGPCS